MPQEIIPVTRRDEWLAKRRTAIGASDAPAVLGRVTWAGPRTVYAEKIEGYTPPMNDAMEAGIRLEPAVADWLAEKAHLILKPSVWARHRTLPFIAATPDRLVVSSRRRT